MKIIYFFTFDYSLQIWKDSGNLDRELEYFEFLNRKYNHTFIFITYGDISDYKIIDNCEYIEVVPIYALIKKSKSKFMRYVQSFKIPFILKNKIKNFDIIKQNQLLGSWVSIVFKITTKKPIVTRTGYDMFLFSVYEKKSIFIRLLYYLLTQFTLIFSNIYTVSSSVDKHFIQKNYFATQNKVELIPNWIKIEENKPLKSRSQNKILSIGRLEHQKNLSYLISSFENTNYEIDLYGVGSLQTELKELAKEKRVKVNFLGVLPFSELKKVYNDYKFFISTSYFEGNPKTILEAMSRGCIVVASNIKNNQEVIDDSINGILFDFNGNLESIINELNKDNNITEIISQNAVNKVIKNNSIENVCELEVNTMKKILF